MITLAGFDESNKTKTKQNQTAELLFSATKAARIESNPTRSTMIFENTGKSSIVDLSFISDKNLGSLKIQNR